MRLELGLNFVSLCIMMPGHDVIDVWADAAVYS